MTRTEWKRIHRNHRCGRAANAATTGIIIGRTCGAMRVSTYPGTMHALLLNMLMERREVLTKAQRRDFIVTARNMRLRR